MSSILILFCSVQFTFNPEWFADEDEEEDDWDLAKYRKQKEEEDLEEEEERIRQLDLDGGEVPESSVQADEGSEGEGEST